MRTYLNRRRIGTTVLVLVPVIAVAIFGLQAFATQFGSTPELPGGVLLSDLRMSAKPQAARVAARDKTENSVIELTTWQDTGKVSVVRR